MSRITEIEIAGIKCPLNFSTKAVKEITARYGSIEAVGNAFSGKAADEALTELIWLIGLLNEQGAAYRKIIDGKDEKCFTLEELEIVIGVADLMTLKDSLFAAMTQGMRPTIEVESDPKNATATQP
ncbi:MAG: hypothetical protein AAGU74_13990 [Bacillota bacterium]